MKLLSNYLLTVTSPLNDYQKAVLAKFPKGLASKPELMYEGNPFMDAA